MVFTIWMFPKIVGFTPKSSISIGVFHYKSSISGYPLFLETPIYHRYPVEKKPYNGLLIPYRPNLFFFLMTASRGSTSP